MAVESPTTTIRAGRDMPVGNGGTAKGSVVVVVGGSVVVVVVASSSPAARCRARSRTRMASPTGAGGWSMSSSARPRAQRRTRPGPAWLHSPHRPTTPSTGYCPAGRQRRYRDDRARGGTGERRPPQAAEADRAFEQPVRVHGEQQRDRDPEDEQHDAGEAGALLVEHHVDRPVVEVHAVADGAEGDERVGGEQAAQRRGRPADPRRGPPSPRRTRGASPRTPGPPRGHVIAAHTMMARPATPNHATDPAAVAARGAWSTTATSAPTRISPSRPASPSRPVGSRDDGDHRCDEVRDAGDRATIAHGGDGRGATTATITSGHTQ